MIGETGARRDFRQALRALLATRLISAVGVVTLATAIGAVTAVFSLLNSVLLRPLPVHAPDRLMSVSSEFAISHGFTAGAGWSVPMWDRFQPFASRFDGAFAWYTHDFTLGRGIETATVTGLYVSGEFFSTLGVRAERGRLLGTGRRRSRRRSGGRRRRHQSPALAAAICRDGRPPGHATHR